MQKQSFTFNPYQKFIVFISTVLQFTVILDFMVLSPLGVHLLKSLQLTPVQFGIVVSAYAFSAGLAGFLTAGFADKYDRKKLLLVFYSGFLIGTLLCGLAQNYTTLLIARIVAGLFGGAISSIIMAIIADLFPMALRGRVIGFTQMGFGVSQVVGIPFSIFLADHYNWHMPFLLIVGIGLIVGVLLVKYMQPVIPPVKEAHQPTAFTHLYTTLTNPNYMLAFFTNCFLSLGGYMLMPFANIFLVNNVRLPQEKLSLIFIITGLFTVVIIPLVGRVSDKIGKYKVFLMSTLLTAICNFIYVNLPPTPFTKVVIINIFLFIGIMSRMVASSALMTAVPVPQDRGAFMSINSSMQQLAGGIASVIAGSIVVQATHDSPLQHFDRLGYIVITMMLISLFLMKRIHRYVKLQSTIVPTPAA